MSLSLLNTKRFEIDKEAFHENVGRNIFMYRKKAGLKQSDIAKCAGVTHQQAQKYEAGTVTIYLETILKIADYLKISIEDLLKPCEK